MFFWTHSQKNYLLQIIYLQKNKFNVKLYIILIKRRQGKKGGDRSKPFQKNHWSNINPLNQH